MNRKDIIPLALASGFERVEKEYQFLPDTYEVSASDLELFVEKLTRKPEQEPVARVKTVGGYPDASEHTVEWLVKFKDVISGQLLYAAPPARKPLTDTEIAGLWDGHVVPVFGKNGINPIVFARAIERAHGITND